MAFLFDDGSAGGVTRSDRVLHTPSVFAKEALFYVQETGSLVSLRPHLCRRENQKSYLLILVLEGEGTVTFEGESRVLRSGAAAFLDCMFPYSHISSGENPWRLAWVHFAGRSLPRYYQYFRDTHESPFLTLDDPDRLSSLLSKLLLVTKEPGAGAELRASELLHRLVTLALTSGTDSPVSDKLESVRQYLDEHYAEPLNLDILSEKFYMSKFYLSRTFSERFQMRLGEYLLRRRVTAAKALLRFSSQPVSEIAKACGVPDANYFSKVFYKAEGLTPSDFRKQW